MRAIVPLTPGSRLGSHEITALLGKGGMGEVYRARATKQKRDVAIKILPQSTAAIPNGSLDSSVKPRRSPR